MASKLRIVNYAVNGSGVGHLTRLVAINRWVRRYAAYAGFRPEVYFLSSSEADGLLFAERFASFKLPSKTVVRDAGLDKLAYLALAKQWVWHSLGLLRPDLLVVDTFPRGSFGELLSALDLVRRRAFVYRPLKEEIASRPDFQAMLPLYDAIVVPDDAAAAPVIAPAAIRARVRHVGPVAVRERVELRGREAVRAELGVDPARLAVYVTAGGGGDPDGERRLHAVIDALEPDPSLHLIVGAGPLYRGRRRAGPRLTWLERAQAAELMAAFDLAISAAGYNSFFELMHLGVPAALIPQEKIADEQDARAARAVAAGAAVLLAPACEPAAVRAAVETFRDPAARARAAEAARALAPRNHARDAAAELLRLVLPPAAVEAAEEAVSDALLAAAGELELDFETFLEVQDALDPRPRAELDPEAAAEASERAVALLRTIRAGGAPVPAALRVVGPLLRKLPRADVAARAEAASAALEAFAPFGDWSGAAMVVRAFQTEKELPAAELAAALAAFLARLHARGEDLYRGLAILAEAQARGAELPSNAELLRAAAGALG